MGLISVPHGEIATIVTCLEMTRRPPATPLPASPFRLARWARPGLDQYRTLFRRIGERWLWFSRLVLSDEVLAAIIHHPQVDIHAVLDPKGIEIGLIELDFREEATCQIAYFGLVPELAGRQFGRWMMAQVMAMAWRKGVARLCVHSCTLDHPSALGFYLAQGFTAYDRMVEIFPDPRLSGHLPRSAAPQIPLLEPERRA